jgi:ribonuclease HI
MDIYTDGAYSGLKKTGGWAFYIPELHIRVCGKVKDTTNNRMELTGAIKALEFIDESNIEDKEITIWSDSQYLVETMAGQFKQKTNLDLWADLEQLKDGLFAKKIIFRYIKGHSGEKNGNNIADILANLISQI